MRVNRKVCFIGGAGHSGSTLLGLVLGAHPSIFYAGEARKSLFLRDERKSARKRMCKVCGPTCPIWSTLERDEGEDLYEALSKKTGRPMVCDSTKSLPWLEEQLALVAARGANTHFVFLVRDGRAVLASGLRKYPETSIAEHTERWCAQLAATEALATQLGPERVTRLRYEELVTDPEATIDRLAATLGIERTAAMMDPWGAEQHPLGGNAGTQSLIVGAQTRADGALPISGEKRGYYASHPRTFVLDRRWERELTPEVVRTFEELAGETQKRAAWNG